MMFVPGVTYPIDENTPRVEGRKLLVFGTAAWESMDEDRHRSDSLGWHVATWEPNLTVDYESENYDYIGGFKSVTHNPYSDYIRATHWQVYPADPV